MWSDKINPKDIMKDDLMVWKKSAKKDDQKTKKLDQHVGTKNHSSEYEKKPKQNNLVAMNEMINDLENKKSALPFLDEDNPVKPPEEQLEKYRYRKGFIDPTKPMRHPILQRKVLRREVEISKAEEIAARTEILRGEEQGFLEADPGEVTRRITQKRLARAVDITSAAKHFELNLRFGPYRHNYSRNGRYLLLGGKKGHLAALDWVTKKLMCEINVMEDIFDVQWLHNELMFAAAQKNWVYIYDNQGVELHCMKNIFRPLKITFLPYHFLLVSSSDTGYLSWLDTSTGKLVTNTNTYLGSLNSMAQNPTNAVICVGNSRGVVSMWSPNQKKPLVKMFCHNAPLVSLAVDTSGHYMATSSVNKEMRIWDVRKLVDKPLHDYIFDRGAPMNLAFSQRGLLGISLSNCVEIYKEPHLKSVTDCYMSHFCSRNVFCLEFSPFEDILGIATASGFTSALIPGSGEPNFDALEVNPVMSKAQRKEAEVRSLLDKIQPEMITLDPNLLMGVYKPTEEEKVAAMKQIVMGKAPKVQVKLKNKRKRRVYESTVKSLLREKSKKEYYGGLADMKNTILKQAGIKRRKGLVEDTVSSALDRFKKK